MVGASPLCAFTAGAPVVEDEDIITLLTMSLGGRDIAIAAWAKMSLAERQILRDQAGRIALMAQGAERAGLAYAPDVARALQWGISSFLADAWERKIISETDLSEDAMRAFYEAHQQWYVDSEGRQISFQESIPRVRADMIQAAIVERLKELGLR